MILNKRRDMFVNIYDKKYNTMYESKDVTITKTYSDEIDELLKDAQEKCKEKVVTLSTYKWGNGSYNNYYAAKYGRDLEPGKPEKEKKIKVKGNMDETIKMGRTGWPMSDIYGIDEDEYDRILNDPFGYM